MRRTPGVRQMRSVEIEKHVATAVRPSQRVLETASMFGLGVDEQRQLAVVPRCTIPLPADGVVFVTGPSGGGKTTILNLIAERCGERGWPVIRFDDLPVPPDVPLVDVFDGPGVDLARATALLAMAGLGDAFVMLRCPQQLSDGQRYRLRLAQTIELAERGAGARGDAGADVVPGAVVIADEFGATLDRLTAKNIARSMRRWTRRSGHTLICATTHDDLLEALDPDVLIYKGLDEGIEVLMR
jgi:ABC-type ATPase with predicted acetyltransferase domain